MFNKLKKCTLHKSWHSQPWTSDIHQWWGKIYLICTLCWGECRACPVPWWCLCVG